MKTRYLPPFGLLTLIALSFTLAGPVCSQPLCSELLDDFEDGIISPLWNASAAAITVQETNGHFIFTGLFGQTSYGGANTVANRWYDRHFGVLDGRSLEIRADLVRADANDTFAFISWDSTGPGAGYSFGKDEDEIFLLKSAPGGRHVWLFWEEISIKNPEVTLVLSFQLEGDNLVIRIRVLDKENNYQPLFDRTFIDTPLVDSTAPIGSVKADQLRMDPDSGPPLVSDTGVPFLTIWKYNPLPELVEAQVVFDNLAVCEIGPPIGIEQGPSSNQAILFWQPTPESHIVLEASSVVGPWTPKLAPTLLVDGRNQVTVDASEQAQCFQLTLGQQFSDEFTDGLEGWETNYFGISTWPSYVSIEAPPMGGEGQVRINASPAPVRQGVPGSVPDVRLLRPDWTLKDVSMSIDILAWDHSKRNACGLIARREPEVVAYFGGLIFQSRADRSKAELWSFTTHGLNFSGALFTIDPTRQYRLVLSAVKGALTVELFDLEDLTGPVSTHSDYDDSQLHGSVGLVFMEDSKEGMDMTVGNFFVTGTTQADE